MLYRLIEDPKEGELVTYLGVYALRWHDHPEEPTVAFIEDRDATNDAALGAAVREALGTPWSHALDRMYLDAKTDGETEKFLAAVATAMEAENVKVSS